MNFAKIKPFLITIVCVIVGVVIAQMLVKQVQIDPSTGKTLEGGSAFKGSLGLKKLIKK